MKSILAILIGFTVGIIACVVLLVRWVKALFRNTNKTKQDDHTKFLMHFNT